jgi:ABC-2 type transport system ATP-binding protein
MSGVKGRGRADELVQLFDLNIHAKVRTLSTGNKQKLAVILAFLGNPKLLIMDEPTRGLDPLLQNQLYQLLKEFTADGGTVFFSSHNLAEVQQLCSNVAVIRQGEIVTTESMADILQMQVHIVRAVATTRFKGADFRLRDLEVIAHHDNMVSLKVHGGIDPLMKVLAKYELKDLEVSHASLEDVFMEFY